MKTMNHGPNKKIPTNIHNASEGPGEDPLNFRTIPYVMHRLNGRTASINPEDGRLATTRKTTPEPQKTSGPRIR